MELKHRERVIQVKIVYYGPAVGGKTTNLQMLHAAAVADRRGDMVSINSAQDRTILFDLLPLKAAGYKGFELRIQVLAVPGQPMYAATRKLVLRGADGLVFVANSATDRWAENVSSYREMTQNLLAHQLDPAALPLILQYNKRDLPQVTPLDYMDRALNARKVPAFPGVAIYGEGVLETFTAILGRTMADLSTRYKILALDEGQNIDDWTRRTVLGVFGRRSLSRQAEAEAPHRKPDEEPEELHELLTPLAEAPAVQRAVKIALPEEALGMDGAGPDARSNETLVESYAQASAALAEQLEEVREERDRARQRLEDLRHTLLATEALLLGHPPAQALRAVLGRMAKATDCRVASLLAARPGGRVETVVCLGAAKDPVLTHPAGPAVILNRLMNDREPTIHRATEGPELAAVLGVATPPFTAVAAVPLHGEGHQRLHGLAVLYFTADSHLPPSEVLEHLGEMASRMGVVLEMKPGRGSQPQADGLLPAAVTGVAAMKGLAEIGAALEPLWERLQAVGLRPGVPPEVGEEVASAAGGLVALALSARSLVDFGRRRVQRERVPIRELIGRYASGAVSVRMERGLDAVSGDRTLLRLALDALFEMARGCRQGQAGMVLQATMAGGQTQFTLLTAGTPPEVKAGTLEQALARRIAEAHGGELTVTAESGMVRLTLSLGK